VYAMTESNGKGIFMPEEVRILLVSKTITGGYSGSVFEMSPVSCRFVPFRLVAYRFVSSRFVSFRNVSILKEK